LADVSDSQETVLGWKASQSNAEVWGTPKFEGTHDEFWARLGQEWQAVDGIAPGVPRVYVMWGTKADGRPMVSGICIAGEVTTDVLRAIPVSRLENLRAALNEPRRSRFELPPLVRGKEDDPDEFAGRVAFYYKVFAASTSRPAVEIAEHSKVPVGTVRGWIREARLRGKLPPGKQGRAG
jgi:hypothetical protein